MFFFWEEMIKLKNFCERFGTKKDFEKFASLVEVTYQRLLTFEVLRSL